MKKRGKRGCDSCNPPAYISPTIAEAHRFLRRVADTLTAKNRAYGDSAAHPVRIFSAADTAEQIRVRIDDKLSRTARGQVTDHEDTLLDLCGYIAILAAVTKKQ